MVSGGCLERFSLDLSFLILPPDPDERHTPSFSKVVANTCLTEPLNWVGIRQFLSFFHSRLRPADTTEEEKARLGFLFLLCSFLGLDGKRLGRPRCVLINPQHPILQKP